MEATGRAGTDEESAPLLPIRAKFSWSVVAAPLVCIGIINCAWELAYLFMNQLIFDAGIAPDEKSVGFYSGLISTVASCFDFASIMPGSYAANRWGRKVVLCSALIGASVGLSLLGISKTLTSIIISWCIGSALGPQIGWATTIIILGDLVDPAQRGTAFSAMHTAYRAGQLFSPISASTLAHPKARYAWFQSNFWERYPYALPSWVGSMACIVALCITICYVPETAPSTSCVNPKSDEFQTLLVNDPPSDATPGRIGDHTLTEQPRAGIFTPHIIQLLISSWILYFMYMAAFVLFPLWAFTPISSGGLGASELAIGSFIAARGIIKLLIFIPFTMTIFTISGSIAFPLLSTLAKRGGFNSFRFNLAMILYFITTGVANYCTTCMIMMISQVSSVPHVRARLVGISQSVQMLGRCMAPIIVLSIFEFSIKNEILGGNIIWIFLFGASLAASGHSFMLRARISIE